MDNHELGSVSLVVPPAIADYPPGATFGPLPLAEFELVWLLSGSAVWLSGDEGTAESMRPGDVLLLPPGTDSEFRWDNQLPTRHGYVHFSAGTDPCGRPLWRRGQIPGPFGGMLDYLLWLAQERPGGWWERAEDVLAATVRAFVSGHLPQPGERPEPAALAAALDYVRSEWLGGMRPVSRAELAAVASVSESFLSRMFRERYGCGVVTALELVRLHHAATMMTRSNLNVAQVARSCGFTDPLYFSRRFRTAFGRSPRAYRDAGLRNTAAASAPGITRLAHRLQSSG